MARVSLVALILAFLVLTPLSAAELIPHHAFYTLQLGSKRGQSSIVDASGGMAIEMSETCDAWLTKQRLRLRIVRDEGEEVVTDNNFTSWESKDGLRYRFSVRNRLNGEVNEELRGEARLTRLGGEGVATFTQPERQQIKLPKGTLFPSAHVEDLIDAARGGARVFHRVVFDGATKDGPDEVDVVIGKPGPLEKLPGLQKQLGARVWPMRWAFFTLNSRQETPDYELAVRMLENGVVVDLGLVYDEFDVEGKVDFFEPLPRPKC